MPANSRHSSTVEVIVSRTVPSFSTTRHGKPCAATVLLPLAAFPPRIERSSSLESTVVFIFLLFSFVKHVDLILLYSLVCGIIVDFNLSCLRLFYFDFSFRIPSLTFYLDDVNTGSQNRKFGVQ